MRRGKTRTLGGMGTSRVALANLGSGIVIAVLYFFSQYAAPSWHLKETRLSCSTSGTTATFPDMQACRKDSAYRVGCGCAPIRNHWSTAYQFGLVPLLVGVIGFVALRGPLVARLATLNAAIVAALLAQLMQALMRHDSSVMLIPLMPLIAALFCGLATAWFLLLQFGRRHFVRQENAT
jgi:hypothetical protein